MVRGVLGLDSVKQGEKLPRHCPEADAFGVQGPLGDHNQIKRDVQSRSVEAEELAQYPFDPVAFHRGPGFPAHGQTDSQAG
jgi:hypothetical protein